MSQVTPVTDANFSSEVEQHDGLTVVDFWATWCGPCRMVAPIMDQLATEYAGQAKVAKVDVDNNQGTATRFNIRSIPTVLFFKGGKVVDQVVGAAPKARFDEVFKRHLASAV
jgi:thioredoxin 1